jgi:hypothetical protein
MNAGLSPIAELKLILVTGEVSSFGLEYLCQKVLRCPGAIE